MDISTNIIGASYPFANLSLSDYYGHHVGYLASTVLKLIKIMQQVCVHPVDLGSKLLFKVYDISCDYFNQRVFTHLEKALTLVQKYYLLDPKLMFQDSEYPTYGPVGICSLPQSYYGD